MATLLRTRPAPLRLDLARLENEPGAIEDYYREVQDRVRNDLPPLAEVLWLPEPELAGFLRERDAVLGAATLRSGTLLLFARLFREEGLNMAEYLFGPHEATLRASEKQTILPHGAHVQKTLSLLLEDDLVLVTCVGDHVLTRAQRCTLVAALGLPHKVMRRATINPPGCIVEQKFGLLRGMVSPFLPPGFGNELRAITQLSWSSAWEGEESYSVAISLSPCKSLLIPLRCYRHFLREHLRWSMPSTPLVELDQA